MKHKIYVDKYNGSLETLAEELGNLRYDALADFLRFLSTKLDEDSKKDHSRNRVKLASCLKRCSLELSEASTAIDRAWDICAPYCKDEQ